MQRRGLASWLGVVAWHRGLASWCASVFRLQLLLQCQILKGCCNLSNQIYSKKRPILYQSTSMNHVLL
jgi:hypothetical protein